MKIALALLAGIGASGCSSKQNANCGVPRTSWMKQHCIQSCALTGPMNILSVDGAGQITWNHVRISATTLATYLEQSNQLSPESITFFQNIKQLDCGIVERIRRIMDTHLCGRSTNCGEGDLEQWERTPLPPNAPVS